MMIKDFNHVPGINCKSNTIRDLLEFEGIKLSEPMIIGLCEGYYFIYLNIKLLGFPFTSGRTKDGWLKKFSANTGIKFEVRKTTSNDLAWLNLKKKIDINKPVGIEVDYYYLDYVLEVERVHFMEHTISVCGYDNDFVYVGENHCKDIQKVSREQLIKARSARVPGMVSANNLSYVVSEITDVDLERILPKVLKCIGQGNMNPPFKGAGYQGIYKLANEIGKSWNKYARQPNFLGWSYVAAMWDDWGTGGAIFRDPLRDFLRESQEYVNNAIVREAYEIYDRVARRYHRMTQMMRELDYDRSKEPLVLKELSNIALIQAQDEERAMSKIAKINA